MKISACMIAKNEEDNIAKCISSYKDIVNEIIVVDTGSTDKTVKIAKNLGAKVYFFKWINDFAKAKNYAISRAKGDWIIFLDADEYFDENKAKNIPALIRKYSKGNKEIIACKMINIDEETGEYLADFVQTRIFKNTGNICYINSVHERLHSKGRKIQAVYIEENELVIYHTGYSKDRIISKAERNLELLLKEIEKPKIDPTMYHFLSDTYLTLKDYEQSIKYSRKFLSNKMSIEGLNSKVYQNLISAMVESKHGWQEIYDVIEEAMDIFPDHPMFQVYLARTHHFTNKYEAALKGYKKTIELQENYTGIEINFVTGKIHEIEYSIACIYEYKNKGEDALGYYIKALTRKKDYVPALQGLLRLLKKIDEAETIELLNNLYDANNKEELETLLKELTQQRYKKVLAYYVNLINEQFGHQDFSIVIMFLTNGKYEQAFKHFYEAYLTNYEDSYAKLAIVSGFLNKNEENLLKMGSVVRPSLKRIIKVLLSIDKKSVLYKEDLEDYLNILTEIIKVGEQDTVNEYIDLKNNFEENIINLHNTIGNILKENRLYQLAIKQYNEQLENDITGKDTVYIYFNTGYCYYKIKDFKQSLNYFEKAIDSGYLKNDIKEFLQWTEEQTNDNTTKKEAQNLINKFSKLKSEAEKKEKEKEEKTEA